MKTGKPLHKMFGQSAGSLHLEWKRCGRQNCHCASGDVLHGPYGAHHWRENGVQKKRYIPMARLVEILTIIQERKDERDNLGEVRRLFAALKLNDNVPSSRACR